MPRKRSPEFKKYHAEYLRNRYANDPDYKAKHLALVAKNRAKRMEELAAILRTARSNGCLLCPEREPCCMSFHHIDPATKLFDIAAAVRQKVTVAKLNAELVKCVCVCENCHRKIHAGVISLPQ